MNTRPSDATSAAAIAPSMTQAIGLGNEVDIVETTGALKRGNETLFGLRDVKRSSYDFCRGYRFGGGGGGGGGGREPPVGRGGVGAWDTGGNGDTGPKERGGGGGGGVTVGLTTETAGSLVTAVVDEVIGASVRTP